MSAAPLRRKLVVAYTRKYHGLGNRLRVTLGAKSLAEYTGRRFAYTWPIGSKFGARMTELWEFPERRLPVTASRMLSLRYPYRREDLAWMAAAAGEFVWQIRTPHALHLPPDAATWGAELRTLTPVDDLAERIRDFHHRHLAGPPYIGVMVRAHAVSNAETIAHSPVSWFVERMLQVRQDRPDIRFFVSCDTVDAQSQILETVPGSVALADKGAYNSKAALRSSVVDLYLLAGAAHLIGPYFSSFPEVAQQLAGDRVRLETSRTAPATRLRPADVLTSAEHPLRPWRRAGL